MVISTMENGGGVRNTDVESIPMPPQVMFTMASGRTTSVMVVASSLGPLVLVTMANGSMGSVLVEVYSISHPETAMMVSGPMER